MKIQRGVIRAFFIMKSSTKNYLAINNICGLESRWKD